MTDLDILIAGAMVSFLAVAGAYVAIRHRANEAPVDSYKPVEDRSRAQGPVAVEAFTPGDQSLQAPAVAQSHVDVRN